MTASASEKDRRVGRRFPSARERTATTVNNEDRASARSSIRRRPHICRVVSLTRVMLPKSRRAASLACSGDCPRLIR